MSQKTDNLLVQGLSYGFAGKTKAKKVTRASFILDSSHLNVGNSVYHDEWFADRAGGGQEIVKVGSEKFTRVYAGGTIPKKDLVKLGTNNDEVMNFLKKQIVENGKSIRLYHDFTSCAGNWNYSYKVVYKNISIPLTLGQEIISYKGKLVFEHIFVLCPID